MSKEPQPTTLESAPASAPEGRKPRSSRRRHRAGDLSERRRLPLLLRRAWYGLNQAFRHLATHADITPDQFTVLRTLLEQEPSQLTQRALSEMMSSDPNTIASLLQRMEAQGWVKRHVHPEDRRAHCLSPTPAGRRKFLEVRRLAVALQKSVLAALPADEREAFLGGLERIADACQQAAHIGRVTSIRITNRKRNESIR